MSFDADLPESYSRTVFVDPYTAQVRATLDTYAEWLPARGVIDNLHRSLLLGAPGQVYTELAASWTKICFDQTSLPVPASRHKVTSAWSFDSLPSAATALVR